MYTLRKTISFMTLVAILCLLCCLPWLAQAEGGAGGSVQTGPSIVTQPKSVSVAEGKKATFTVEARNVTEYQWYYRTSSTESWKAVSSNGTSATYSLTTAARHNGYQYRCQLKSKNGSGYTNTVTLTVKSKPAITTQPKSVTVEAGKNASFKVAATDAESYQWYYRTSSDASWKAVSNNGTSATYSLTTAARHKGYQYRCLVKNSVGSVYSSTATLTVKVKPVITTQPKSLTVNEGAKATFKVEATGAESYQWYYRTSSTGSWKAVSSNGTSATYSLTTAARHNGYQYRCLLKNADGSAYTQNVTLTVKPKPVITTQPKSQTVNEGKKATLTVAASNAASYQWYYRTSSAGSWKAVSSNGTSATYSLTTAARHNGYQYRCLVKNSAGSVYTKIATLTVNPKPAISTQPKDATVTEGQKATFKVVAKNAESYQWYYRTSSSGSWTTAKSNGTSASYTVTTGMKHNGYQYRCLVKNSVASVYSKVVTLTVEPDMTPPTIVSQPGDVAVYEGDTAFFSVTAEKATGYQWEYYDPTLACWQSVPSGGNSATYYVATDLSMNGYYYSCLVYNDYNSIWSDTVLLTVLEITPEYTLTFDGNGGTLTGIGSKTVKAGYEIGELSSVPTRSGCTFAGWYTAPNGGTAITAATIYSWSGPVTVYAHWESGWVSEDSVPSGAAVIATSWSYRESQESTESTMDGYMLDGDYWMQTGTESAEYANFPSGEYNTAGYKSYASTDKYYSSMMHAPYTASENETTKTEVSNQHAGWIYWHWAYNAQYSASANRIIAYKPGTYGSSSYVYGYWYSIKSTIECPQAKSSYNTIGQYPQNGRTTYDCTQLINNTSYVPASHKTASGTIGLCTWRFYRLEYFTSTKTIYQKYYQFHRDVSYSTADPGDGYNISDKVKYVKWSNNQ